MSDATPDFDGRLSVVVPVRDERENVATLLAEIHAKGQAYAKQHGFTALHPARHLLDYPGFIEDCRREGRLLHVWTVDSRIDMQAICQSGVDAFITDCPDNGRKIADGVELS